MNLEFSNIKAESTKNYLLFAGIAVLSVVLLILTVIFGLELKFTFFLLFLSTVGVALINVNFTFTLLLFILFIPYAIPVHQAVVFSIFVPIIIFFTYKNITSDELINPLLKCFILYFIITLPSLGNSYALILSIRDMSNLVALIAIFISVLIVIKQPNQMFNIIYFFIAATFIHSIHVIFLGLTTGQRVFGLLGVYYIDFAGLGSLMTFILLLFTKGVKRNIFALAFLVITLGLILTQTRNAWLSTGFAICTLIFYLFFNSRKLFIKKYALINESLTCFLPIKNL